MQEKRRRVAPRQEKRRRDAPRQEKSEDEFLHKGIAERNFTRTWALADDVKVTGSKLKDGVLTISLVHEIPEEKKPVDIKIKKLQEKEHV